MVLILGVNYLPYITIWFWSNFFILLSRLYGVTKTIRIIKRIVRMMPLESLSLDTLSDKIDLLHQRMPFLLLAKKQKCLIRGFLLFFYGKRLGLDIWLRFGCQWEGDQLKTHCWILESGVVRYEVDEVIKEYETLFDYT